MGILIFIAVPPIATFLILAATPAGKPFLSLRAVFGIFWVLAAGATFPIAPASGPDDWFHGIEVIPLYGALGAALAATVAQAIRWWRLRKGKRPFYLIILIAVLFAAFVITTSLGAF